ncbi:hypothetical protein [Nocardioides sp. YIM 152588]|uniref:hypothetical protein n=1 Tax=Nocardioides sp. YIM 152588 TaxID=3158259 RepID=UPI0032E437B6
MGPAAATAAAEEPTLEGGRMPEHPDQEGVLLVRAHREAALEALSHSLGTSSLCALSRTGRAMPAAKFHEGASRAFADVLRAAGAAPDDELEAIVVAVAARWEADEAGRAGLGPDWAAYAAGGGEGLADLVDELRARAVVRR